MSSYELIIQTEPPPHWDEWVSKGKADPTPLFQSTCWANRMKAFFRLKPYYFTLSLKNEPVLLHLVFVGRYPAAGLTLRAIAKRILKPFLKTEFRWYAQPVTFSDKGAEAFSYLSAELERFAKGFKLVSSPWPIDQAQALPLKWRRMKWATLKLSLAGSLEDVMSHFKQAAKKEIRKAQSLGIKIKRLESLKEFEEYYALTQVWGKRYKKIMYGFKDMKTLIDHVQGQGVYETFVAYYDGRPIAGLSICGDQKAVVELGSFQSEESFRRKQSGPDLLKWTAIQWAHSQGIQVFDLAGVNPFPKTKKEEGIKRFKEKWSSDEYFYWILSS